MLLSDPAVTNFEEPANDLLRQDVTSTISINVELTNDAAGASGDDILATNSGSNYFLQLQLSDVDMAAGTNSVNLSTIAVNPDTPTDLQEGLAVSNSISISAMADVLIPRSHCLSVHFLCVLLSEGVGASYHDNNFDNNVMCKNIDSQKACDPGTFLNS